MEIFVHRMSYNLFLKKIFLVQNGADHLSLQLLYKLLEIIGSIVVSLETNIKK